MSEDLAHMYCSVDMVCQCSSIPLAALLYLKWRYQLLSPPAGSYGKMSLSHVPAEAAFACLTQLFLLVNALAGMHKAMRHAHMSQQPADQGTQVEANRLTQHTGMRAL